MGQDAAAWWQAIVSGIAIIASGLIAVFVPWNERRQQRQREDRARLDIDAQCSIDGGLELFLVYRPEFHHHALSVTVQLVDPPDARLYRGRIDWDKSNGTRPKGSKNFLATNVRYHGAPLERWEISNTPNQYVALMYVEYPDERRGPGRATVEVSIMMHGNQMIARERLDVSAMNVEFYPDGPPMLILDKRRNPYRSA